MKSKATNEVISSANLSSHRIIKSATCPSLSGKSKLTYHVAVDPKGDIHVRVHANIGGGGYWSREYVPMSAIQRVLASVPADQTITSFLLHSLFEGKSQNNSGFLWAVLKDLGLAQLRADKQRCYCLTEGKTFFAEVKSLVASGVDLKVAEPVKRSSKPGSAASAKVGSTVSGKSNAEVPVRSIPAVTPAKADSNWPIADPDTKAPDTKGTVTAKAKPVASKKKANTKTNPQSALGI